MQSGREKLSRIVSQQDAGHREPSEHKVGPSSKDQKISLGWEGPLEVPGAAPLQAGPGL